MFKILIASLSLVLVTNIAAASTAVNSAEEVKVSNSVFTAPLELNSTTSTKSNVILKAPLPSSVASSTGQAVAATATLEAGAHTMTKANPPEQKPQATLTTLKPFQVTLNTPAENSEMSSETSTGNTEASLSAYLKERMRADMNFVGASAASNTIAVDYRVPFWLFGLIPMKITEKVTLITDPQLHPRIKVKFPFFVIFGKTDDQAQVVEGSIDNDQSSQDDTDQALDDAKNAYDDAKDKFKQLLEILQSEAEHKSQETNTVSGGGCSDCDNP